MTSVLLVDDNPKYLNEALPYYGYEVETATDGVQAIDLLSKHKFDIILLDVMMPNMDGKKTLQEIRKNVATKDVPVIMITAVEQKMVECLKIGADDYIVKPFVLQNLLARMEAVLRRYKKSSVVLKELPGNILPLTSREKEVLKMVAEGANNKEIAEKLVLSLVTIKCHMNSIFKKLNVTSRTQAVLLAIQLNLLED